MRTSRRCSSLILVTLLSASVLARAQTADSVSPEVQALSDRARVESGKGNLKEAVRLYKEAYEIQQSPVLLFNIARTLHKLTRFDEAIVYYQLFVDSPVAEEGQKRKAREAIELLRGASGQKNDRPAKPPPAIIAPSGVSPRNAESSGPAMYEPRATTASASQVSEPAQIPPSASHTAPDSLSTPVYRKWWFWTLIGGAVVAGGVGLGVGLAVAKNNGQLGGSYPNVPEGAYQYNPVFLIRVP